LNAGIEAMTSNAASGALKIGSDGGRVGGGVWAGSDDIAGNYRKPVTGKRFLITMIQIGSTDA
jgi:hypothetical protein